MNTLFHLQNIYWREPLWLLLIFQPILFILIKKLVSKNNASLYAEKKLHHWVVFPSYSIFNRYLFSKNAAYMIAWLLFSIALAGPRTPLNQYDKQALLDNPYGANIMLVVDLSKSMKAIDVAPNRLRRAIIEIHELLEIANDHRIGITVFSARPHLFVPLTSDHTALKIYLESLYNLSFPTMGSDPVAAVLFAQQELEKTKGKSAVVLITDGDFPNVSKSQLEQLQQANIPLFTLGIGSIEGEAIQNDDGTWLKYKQQDVITRMNENNLERLSDALNGKYSPVYDDNNDWNTLYNKGIAQLNLLSNIDQKQRVMWRELFYYFLLPSIILFWFSLSTYRFKSFNRSALLAVTIASIFVVPENKVYAFNLNFGQTQEQLAYHAYTNKNYDKAGKIYQNIQGYLGHLGQANSLYKMGHYQKAIPRYISAILNAQTNSQRANALYNLANSYFRTGQFSIAITTYQDVLRYQPNNKSCIHNIKISQLLKENIEKRLKEKEKIITAPRQGNGPRSASIADGTEINQNTSVSTDDSESILNNNIPLPKLPDINEDRLTKLIIIGLNNIKLAKQGETTSKQSQVENSSSLDIANAQQQIRVLSDNQHLLWKRLFEIEEGFPAPVETAKTLPGLKPW